MSEKVVLPKFDLPGSGPHPAVRALWIVGGLLAVSMLVLGGAMWRHHAAEEAAAQEAKAKIAQQAAEAQAAKAKALAKAEAAAAKDSQTKDGQTKGSAPATGTTTPSASPAVAADAHHRASGSHRHAKATGKGNALAKTDTHAKAPPLSKKKGDDAIDKLLASFK
jgi:hypothetical protein